MAQCTFYFFEKMSKMFLPKFPLSNI